MTNVILNVTASGSWQEITGFPRNTIAFKIQARTAAAVSVRFHGQTNFWTVKANTVAIWRGRFDTGEVEINAAGDTVIEIECGTNALSEFA